MSDKDSKQSGDDNASKSRDSQPSGSPAMNSRASPEGGSTRSIPSPNMPPSIPNIQPMAARPSSALSTHSSASASGNGGGSVSGAAPTPGGGGGQRTTTTSRRGGRTRSRSPVSNVSRQDSTPLMGGAPAGASSGDPFPVPAGGPDARTKSPANPSSVAASAAAAAKAFSNSRGAGRNQQWYDDSQGGRNNNHRGGGDGSSSRYQQHQTSNGYDNNSNNSGSRNWPSEDGTRNGDRSGNKSRRYNGMHDRPSSSRNEHAYNGYSSNGQNGRGSFDKYNQGGANYDRSSGRYGHRQSYKEQGGRNGQSYPNQYSNGPDRHHHRSSYDGHRRNGRDARSSSSGMAPLDSRSKTPQRSGDPSSSSSSNMKRGAGGTSRVIGTPTPIHVPRAKDDRPSSRQAGAPSSVFRERPSGDVQGEHGPATGGAVDNESHSKLLMSLRTPSTSFEEREKSATSKNRKSTSSGRGNSPLSPEEPPRIHHSHHQNAQTGGSGDDQNIFFEPQRSPKPSSGTIEMAPSFSLFNHSFDSLGDGPILNVGASLDATFNSNSFGAGPSGSGDNETPSGNQSIQLPNSSFGNPSPGGASFQGQQQYNLGASSSGGMGLTFGMSPVNSFGNSGQDQRRNSNMMVLGGPDTRSTSPTEVLGMYQQRSYSGGGYGSQGGSGGPTQSPPFRQMPEPMQNLASPNTNGSFGGPAIPYVYTPRSFGGDNSPHVNYHANQSPGNHSLDGGKGEDPNFYVFLRRHKGAFIRCSFLLPGLKGALLESPIKDSSSQNDPQKNKGGSNNQGHKMSDPAINHMGMIIPEPTPQETAVAMRRVVSAVCAFGGCTPNADHFSKPKPVSSDSTQSIFREKKENVVTVTPSSTMGTPPGNRSSSKAKYDELLPSRYYENENRLSWEFEESPPVSSSEDEEDVDHKKKESEETKTKTEPSPSTPSREMSSPTPGSKAGTPSDGKKTSGSSTPGSDQPKMRYRCKLCGQPKQNHTCPYQQSLQRSIGIMVYPAVNAFTSSEPGLLAPALEEMNNFVSGGDSMSSVDGSPSRPTPERKRTLHQSAGSSSKKASTVTPDSLRSANSQTNSPGSSSLSTVGSPHGTPFRNSPLKAKRTEANLSGGAAMSQRAAGVTPPGSSARKKRPHSQMRNSDDQDLLFVSATELKPEQFRIVTASKNATLPDAYTYPTLPLPYAQRKRLSDNLFALSKEVPQLTDECAVVLREAREKDMWDLAVAELMTQVVVVIHCPSGDNRFEGLRQYLLSLGIAC